MYQNNYLVDTLINRNRSSASSKLLKKAIMGSCISTRRNKQAIVFLGETKVEDSVDVMMMKSKRQDTKLTDHVDSFLSKKKKRNNPIGLVIYATKVSCDN